MKKALPILVAVILVVAGAAYVFLSKPAAAPEAKPVFYSPGDPFITNVKDSNHLLKVSLVLVLDDNKATKTLLEQLNLRNAEVRDTVLFILRDLTADEISATTAQDDLREQIRTALNDKMDTQEIKGILFNDFVMQ